MTDWPRQYAHKNIICAFGPEGVGYGNLTNVAMASAAIGNIVTNFHPIRIQSPFEVVQFFVCNGATASGNIVFTLSGYSGGMNQGLIYNSGAIAQLGTTALQTHTLSTPVLLTPGLYALGVGNNNGSGTAFCYTPANAAVNTANGVGFNQTSIPPPDPCPITVGNSTAKSFVCGLIGRPPVF